MRLSILCLCLVMVPAALAAEREPPATQPVMPRSLAALQRYHETLRARADEVEARIQQLRHGLAVTQRADTSPQGLREAMARLDQEKQALELDLAGLEARQEALRRTIAEQSKQMAEQVKDDPIAAELQKVVAVRAEMMERIRQQHEAGRVSASEVGGTAAGLAEARAKLLERQEIVAARAGGDALAAWNRELLNLAIDRAEKRAKAEYVEQRLRNFRGVEDLLGELDKLKAEQQRLQEHAAEVRNRMDLEEQLR